jgi:hypothetical protein
MLWRQRVKFGLIITLYMSDMSAYLLFLYCSDVSTGPKICREGPEAVRNMTWEIAQAHCDCDAKCRSIILDIFFLLDNRTLLLVVSPLHHMIVANSPIGYFRMLSWLWYARAIPRGYCLISISTVQLPSLSSRHSPLAQQHARSPIPVRAGSASLRAHDHSTLEAA